MSTRFFFPLNLPLLLIRAEVIRFHASLMEGFVFLGKARCHSSEKRGICLMKCSTEKLQILAYFWNMKNPCSFSYSKIMAKFEAFRKELFFKH